MPYYSPNVNLNTLLYNRRDKTDLASNRDKNVTDSVTATVTETLSKRIETWVRETNGWFSVRLELDTELGIISPTDKDNRRQILKRLKEKGIVEQHPTKSDLHRYSNPNLIRIDFKKALRRNILPLKWPFAIENYVDTYPRNVIVIAGSPNAGKTAFLLDFICRNQGNFSVFYFSSEMGEDELAARLALFPNIALDEWNFEAVECSSNFTGVIQPDSINIIDYLEITDEFYLVAGYIKAIAGKLNNGIAIIELQKAEGARLGRGKEFSSEKPRLYLSMDDNKLIVVKAKNWHQRTVNPNRMVAKFEIVNGCEFRIIQPLHHEDY